MIHGFLINGDQGKFNPLHHLIIPWTPVVDLYIGEGCLGPLRQLAQESGVMICTSRCCDESAAMLEDVFSKPPTCCLFCFCFFPNYLEQSKKFSAFSRWDFVQDSCTATIQVGFHVDPHWHWDEVGLRTFFRGNDEARSIHLTISFHSLLPVVTGVFDSLAPFWLDTFRNRTVVFVAEHIVMALRFLSAKVELCISSSWRLLKCSREIVAKPENLPKYSKSAADIMPVSCDRVIKNIGYKCASRHVKENALYLT